MCSPCRPSSPPPGLPLPLRLDTRFVIAERDTCTQCGLVVARRAGCINCFEELCFHCFLSKLVAGMGVGELPLWPQLGRPHEPLGLRGLWRALAAPPRLLQLCGGRCRTTQPTSNPSKKQQLIYMVVYASGPHTQGAPAHTGGTLCTHTEGTRTRTPWLNSSSWKSSTPKRKKK